jgi:MFS family permease
MTAIPTAAVPAIKDADRALIASGAFVSMFMAVLDQTIVAPVIPTIGAALGGSEYLFWTVSAYFLTSTATTPLYGKIADIRGRRPTLLAAIVIFVLGSVLCAVAPTLAILIAGRAVQGLGGGGLIAEHTHWSVIFWLNLPLAAMAIVVASGALKRLPWNRRDHKLDVWGAVLVVSATSCLLLALAFAPQAGVGWSSPRVIGLLVATVVLYVSAWRHLRRFPAPLIPLDVLTNKVVRFATSSMFCTMTCNISLSVFVPLYLLFVLHQTTAKAGLGLVPFMIGTVIGSNSAARTMAKVTHYKRLPVAGLALGALSLAYVAARVSTLGFWEFEVLILATGIFNGFQFPIVIVAVQNSVDPRDIGVATGVLTSMRALGSSIGVAIIGAVGAASGIAIGRGKPTGGEHAVSVMREVTASSFAPVFLVAAMAALMSSILFAAMPELPLRGRGSK